MNRNIESEYPYGKFPHKHTKNGQKEYFESLTHNNTQSVTTAQMAENYYNEPNQPSNASFDISKLLPLIKLMGNKKNISSTDMLQFVLPLMGGNMSQMTEIMNLFNKDSTVDEVAEDIEIDTSTPIDKYERIE